MTYLERNRISRKRKAIYFVVIVILLLFGLLQYFAPHLLPGIMITFASPFWRADFAVNNGSLSSTEKLLEENINLNRELASINEQLNELSYLRNQNEEYAKLLELASSTKLYPAIVLKRPPFSLYDELIIDVGINKNLSSTTVVYSLAGNPIGRVVDTFSNASKAILFSSFGQKTEVLIGSKNIPAIAMGRGGGNYEIELPKGLEVNIGDSVTSISLGNKLLGTIESIDDKPSLTFEKAYFKTPVSIYSLKWVMIGNH